jgi:hypothetical protein
MEYQINLSNCFSTVITTVMQEPVVILKSQTLSYWLHLQTVNSMVEEHLTPTS